MRQSEHHLKRHSIALRAREIRVRIIRRVRGPADAEAMGVPIRT